MITGVARLGGRMVRTSGFELRVPDHPTGGPPDVGQKVMAEVAQKHIPEVWLNPGSESDELIRTARALNVEPILACSILGIGENPYA